MTDPNGDNTRTHVVLTQGTMVSHYRIVEKIGAGGMGEVYLAEDTKLGRKVALKFLSMQFSDDTEVRARFVNEACAAAALDHPNICPVYEIDEANNRTYIAMAYIEGESLRDKTKIGPMKIDDLLRIGIDIAKGLEEAHDKKIIHRDIKSANVMISGKGQAKITDFGLARLIDGSRLTRAGVMMGTVAYMSPEQVRAGEVDHRSDIWALGVVLYEMATGKLPFKGERDSAITHQIINEDAVPVSSLRTGVPLDLERIINKCLEKDPSNRYQHVADLAVDLRNVRRDKVATKIKKGPTRFVLPAIVIPAVAVVFWLVKPLFVTSGEPSFENPLAHATFRKLTDIEGSKDAAISPDGKFVAFVSDHDGEFDIWVSQVETGNIYNRTRGQYGDMRRGLQDVGFSANSSEILSFATSHSASPIMSMPLLDGPMRKILRDSVILADWSADGSRLVYYTDSVGDPVFVANGDGTNNREILSADSGMHQHYQRWSVDEEWIYLTRGSEGIWETDLWRVRPDGSQLEQLTEDQVDVTFPAPYSERIVLFIARDEDGAGPWIWAVDVETKVVQRVTIGLEKYSSLSISQDGRRLATTVINPNSDLLNIWQVPILDRIVTEADVTQYELPVQRAQAPRFGNDILYFLSSRGTGDGLWKYGNGRLDEVWNGARSALIEVPMVSPDGQSVAIVLKREGGRNLHVLNSDGSNLRLLSGSIDIRGSGSWSPDGKYIVVGGFDNDGQGLFKISVDDGHSERIAVGDALNPIWSPRGDLIVYAGKQVGAFSTLAAIEPDGSEVSFPELRFWVRGERYRFLPDGSGLVYSQGWFAGQDFFLLDFTTMKSRQLTELAKGARTRTFDISPDGRTIVFDRLREKSVIVLIELADNETKDVKP